MILIILYDIIHIYIYIFILCNGGHSLGANFMTQVVAARWELSWKGPRCDAPIPEGPGKDIEEIYSRD